MNFEATHARANTSGYDGSLEKLMYTKKDNGAEVSFLM